MMKRISRRFTVRALGLLVLVSALIFGSGAAAQSPPAAQLPKVTYTKNTVFHLPVQMEERTRGNLREVCLYVKSGSGDWVRQETGQPTMSHFSYKVPHDGEYWFSLVTVDKAGRMTPPDVGQEPPGLRVMVDTQPPVIDVQPWTSPENDFCLRCQIQDANPDLNSLKATYRDQTGEHVLEPVPGSPNVFKIAGRDLLNQPLRISGADLCGNVASREVNVREMVVAALQMNKAASSKIIPVSATSDAPLPPSGQPITAQHAYASGPANLPTDSVKTEVQRPAPTTLPPVPEKGPSSQSPGVVVPPPPPTSSLTQLPPAQGLTSENPLTKPGAVGAGTLPAANTSNKQILNTTHATVDYRIDQVGPSGIGKVEVYLTGDNGLNWQRLQEDADRRSPAEIDLPGEGVFGIRLVITNGNGFGGTPPARGDAPTCWIEVDTTAPFLQLRPIEPIQNGTIDLRWTASDKNLGAEPINLYYRTRPEGPWQAIARNFKNEGLYRWSFPRDQGSQFFVKVEVVDLAGNIAHAETPSAIVLDMTEPHASVIGISGITPRVTPAAGN
jgi:hypothetical protein